MLNPFSGNDRIRLGGGCFVLKCTSYPSVIAERGFLSNAEDGRNLMKEELQKKIELTDFEEEYFDACQTFGYKPYNRHTQNQINRKYEKLQEQIDNGEIEFSCRDDDNDVLDCAYNFLLDHIDEINEYFAAVPADEIKMRYEFCLDGEEQ